MEIALVYMVAGISSRFGGKIKAFTDIGKGTLIEYSLSQALPAGFSKIVFIVGNKTEKPFKEFFGESYNGIPVEYVKQEFDETTRDKPWGTADALCTLNLDCKFVICNGDDIYGSKTFKLLTEHLRESNDEAVVGYKLSEAIPEQGKANRGIFSLDEKNYVSSLVEVMGIEKNDLASLNLKSEDLCSMNIYGFNPWIINLLRMELEKFKKQNEEDRKVECLLPEEVGKLIKSGKIKVKIYPASEKWYGVTHPGDEEIIKRSL